MAKYQPVAPWELRRWKSERKGMRALMDVLLVLFNQAGARNGGIFVRRRQRGGSAWSLHAVGRAGDVMVPSTGVGDMIAAAVVAHATPLGVCEVIWNRRRWTEPTGWQPYHGVNPHTDHVHIGITAEVADSPASLESLHDWFAAYLTGRAA